MKWEGPFNTNPVTDLTYRVGSGDASTVALDNNPFEDLNTFAGPFNDEGVYPNGVTGAEGRNVTA